MSLWSRIANAVWGERLNREIDEELQAHIEDAIASGRDPREARRAFGSALNAREASHRIRAAGWLASLFADVRFGWRQLCRNKVTSAAAVLSLALGIGSSISAFRLLDALLWRPLPVAHADRLYALSRSMTGFDGQPGEYDSWAHPSFLLMRDAVRDQANLIAVAYAQRTDLTYSSDDVMEKGSVQYVSGWMFDSFGLKPALGRLFVTDDDRAGAPPYAVLSWDYWNRRFARDPKVLGTTLRIGNTQFQIIGVGPRAFTGTETGTLTDIFLPTMTNQWAAMDSVTWERTLLIANPGVPLEPLRQKLEAVSHAFEVERSKGFKGMTKESIDHYLAQKMVIDPASAGASDLQQEYHRALGILTVLVAVVLLIACVNVANLMTARAAARAQEMALRISIGAGRRRLVQLILAESSLLALAAAAIGALFSWWSVPFVLGAINPPGNPARLIVPLDGRVALFAFGLLVCVVFLLGLLPAMRVSAVHPVIALKGGDDPHARRRLMRFTVAIQVAFCFFVVFLSSLFVATFQKLAHRPLGFSTDRLLLLDTVSEKVQARVVWEQTADTLGEVRGVDSAAISIFPLLNDNGVNGFISINGAAPQPPLTYFLNVTPRWIETMKMQFVTGRDFRRDDTSPGAAIVNETFVNTYFPGSNPIGRTFVRTFDRGSTSSVYTIVGIVRDAPYSSLREPILPVAFTPFHDEGEATFAVRTASSDPLQLAETLRHTVAQLHNGLRVSSVSTQEDLVRDQTVRERLMAMLAAFFAAVALLLASIGLYAVLNYSVLQRRREIGIRMAIGSSRAGIVRLVTLDVFLMIAFGGCAGVALGFGAARYVASLFYQVKATDANIIALPTCAILLTALVATLPAVLRALRTDATEILRTE